MAYLIRARRHRSDVPGILQNHDRLSSTFRRAPSGFSPDACHQRKGLSPLMSKRTGPLEVLQLQGCRGAPQFERCHPAHPRLIPARSYNRANWSGRTAPRVIRAEAQDADVPTPENSRSPKLLLSCVLVVALGVANRVLAKIALVPMGNYVFFLNQLQCFGYVAVYNIILANRVRLGVVTKDMLQRRRLPFVMVGFLEATTGLTQATLAARLPGALLPLLGQSSVMWQLLLSWLILGKKYCLRQVAGASIVILGVVLAGLPPKGLPPGAVEAIRPLDVMASVACTGVSAFNVLLKEKVFRDEKKRLGRDIDVFVVNSTGSAFQALFVFLSLPILTKLKGLSLADMPGYVAEGFQCMMGQVPPSGADPTGAPLAPMLYIVVNLCFNISALYLLRRAGSVRRSLSIASVLPLTVFAFSFPLPLLGQPASLGPFFAAGFAVLMSGLWVFNSAKQNNSSAKVD